MSYQLLPELSTAEYQALKADIGKRGVLVPVEKDEHGNILDGHHRVRACDELGITDYPTTIRVGLSEDEKREHVFTLNLLRRQLGPISWAETFKRLCEVRGVRLGQGAQKAETATVAVLAQEVGVSPRTARHRLQLAIQLTEHPDLAAKVDIGEMELKRARRVARERAAWARRVDVPEPEVTANNDIRVECCDFRHLEVGDVDLILTDPPYIRNWTENWSALGEFAARVLKPGGLLIAYAGHPTFPEAFDGLREHLTYLWLGSLNMPGPNTWIRNLRLNSQSKPILIFCRGSWKPDAERVYFDTFTSPQAEKSLHDWQQQLSPFRKLVETFSTVGDLVVDPCLGAGTTGVACRELGRRFVGCDIDPNAVAVARERLAGNEVEVSA